MAVSSWSAGAVNETIGPGQDRTTLAAFESAHDGETPTLGTVCKGTITGTIAGSAYWSGWQSGQNATTRIHITANVPTDGTDSGGDAIITGDTTFSEPTNPFHIDVTGIEFNGVHIRAPLTGGGDIRIAKCYFRNHLNNAIRLLGAVDVGFKVAGCLFKNVGTANYDASVRFDNAAALSSEFYNNTIYSSRDGLSEGLGLVSVRNNAVGGATRSDFRSVTAMDYCASEDLTATGVNSITNFVPSAEWQLPAIDATGDFQLKPGSQFIGAGEVRTETWFTTLCPTDLKGIAWANPPSIGAFESVAGGPTGIALLRRRIEEL